MEQYQPEVSQYENYEEPKYTLRWLGIQALYVVLITIFTSLIALCIDNFAESRLHENLLSSGSRELISDSVMYCCAVVAISLATVMFVEILFRKGVNVIQYILIAAALCLFYLLLLAISEHLAFGFAYFIVTLMTLGLIATFIYGITKNKKAFGLTAGILAVEYGIIYVLVSLGSMALLIGSITLFLLLGFTMYLTLKLKVKDHEISLD